MFDFYPWFIYFLYFIYRQNSHIFIKSSIQLNTVRLALGSAEALYNNTLLVQAS